MIITTIEVLCVFLNIYAASLSIRGKRYILAVCNIVSASALITILLLKAFKII